MCWSCDADSDAKPKRLKGMQRCSQSATNLRDASTLACHHIRVSRLFIPDGDDFFTSPCRLTGVIWQRGVRFQPTVAQGRQAFANLLHIVRASCFSSCRREPKSADMQGIDFVSGGNFFGIRLAASAGDRKINRNQPGRTGRNRSSQNRYFLLKICNFY